MLQIKFLCEQTTNSERTFIGSKFDHHNHSQSAPEYNIQYLKWLINSETNELLGILTGKLNWDWLYIDELIIDDKERGKGFGTKLLDSAENYAKDNNLTGLWLWTQSWQAPDFYKKLGYQEFASLPDYPKGYTRIGLRKFINSK